jgi:photosystem II stability/assembly factor-like uncharacterized protein
MPTTRHLSVKDGDVLLLVGTTKGAFLLGSRDRRSWKPAGPYFPGHSVYALAWDGRRGRHRLWASTSSEHWGALLRWSDDLGRSWTKPETATLRFPEETGLALQQIWQIRPGRDDEPDVLYCGVAPASLFESRDAGKTWSLVRGLHDHPHRPQWQPGFGGLCLHTILPHPTDRRRLLVAISTGGIYRTEDGGRSFQVSNRGIRAEFLPDKHPEFGQCVHKVVQHPKTPERFFLQNHWGLYRSDDGGRSWKDIANGVPSDFGFAMAVHPRDPDTVFIVPIESDGFRCTPEGRLRVYRTRNAGRSWEALTRGLPQKDAWETVLRDGLATDTRDPAGVYFGTRSGKLFASRDGGTSWKAILEGLPPIVCVKTAEVRRRRAASPRTPRRPPRRRR